MQFAKKTACLFLLSFISCQALVFDISRDEQNKKIFQDKIEAFIVAKRQQERNQNNSALIEFCSNLRDQGLESLQNNPKIVRVAQILLLKNILLKNEALFEKTFNKDKSLIISWSQNALGQYTSGEILAGQFLLFACIKDFMAHFSQFIGQQKFGSEIK